MTRSSRHDADVEDGGASARSRILAAAVREFARRGFAGATTTRIAEAAGVVQPLVHYHYRTKQSLFRAAVEAQLGRLDEAFKDLDRDGQDLDSEAALKLLLRRFVRFSAENPDFADLVGRAGAQVSEVAVAAPIQPPLGMLTRLVKRLQAEERLRPGLDPILVIFAITSAATSIFSQAELLRTLYDLDATDEKVVERHAETVVTLLAAGLIKGR
jgi:AcrR family transcriptional regulator